MADITAIAYDLASSRLRFLTDVQIGFFRRKHKASRDEVRTAAIMADRIRRQRQAAKAEARFTVSPVAVDAPITLSREVKNARGP